MEKTGFTLIAIVALKNILDFCAPDFINSCYSHGIKVTMISGDNKVLCSALGREIGLVDHET